MTHRVLGFTSVVLCLLSATASIAGTFTAGAPASSKSSSSSQDQMTPSPSQTQQLNQPSVTQGAGQPVATITNPQQKLASAPVQDMLGHAIGTVESVQTSAGGKSTSLQIELSTQNEADKSVTLPANKLTYDARSRVVVAQLTQTELDAMLTTDQPNPTRQPPAAVPQGPSQTLPHGY